MTEISVVIPTRNRPAPLGRCLASLCAQTLDPARYEICVVNNGKAELPAKVIALVNAHYPAHRVFMIDQAAPGVAGARNAGMHATTASLVAMGDDDIIAPPDWLAQFVDGFAVQDATLGKIGGELSPLWAAARPDWISDDMLPLLGARSGLGDVAGIIEQAMPAGNGCYRREALNTVDAFPEKLGRKGNNLLSGEDVVDLAMQAAGWTLFYDPAITVQHVIGPERLQPVWMRRRAFWQGISDFAVRGYLQGRGIAVGPEPESNLPLDRSCWGFINDATMPPDITGLAQLRSLGYVLARAGFMPT